MSILLKIAALGAFCAVAAFTQTAELYGELSGTVTDDGELKIVRIILEILRRPGLCIGQGGPVIVERGSIAATLQ